MPIKNGYPVIRNFLKKLSEAEAGVHASSTAFFFFLSMIPMMMLICSALSMTPLIEKADLVKAAYLLPVSVTPLLVSLIENIYDSTFGILSVSAATTIWSAGKGILALMRGLNAMNLVNERRNYFLQRIIASFYLLVFLAVLLFLMIVMVFGNLLSEVLIRFFPVLESGLIVLLILREFFAGVILTFVFMLMYSVLPNVRMKFRRQWPGALFSALAWILFSWGFSVYIQYSDGFSMYGSLTAIIIVMLWLYFGFYLFLAGACLNRYLQNHD